MEMHSTGSMESDIPLKHESGSIKFLSCYLYLHGVVRAFLFLTEEILGMNTIFTTRVRSTTGR